jgi:thioredoxin-dependent peroxiredoxin
MRFSAMAIGLFLLSGTAFASGMLKPGDPFPAWQLKDQNGAEVSSSDFAGKTYLLYFYPKAMTPGCTKEGCTLRDDYSAYEKAGVQIVGVSFDEPKENEKFAAKYHFPFKLLSDTTHKLAVEVGAADSPSRLWARRISYLIGPDGKVLKAYDNVNPAKHAAEVLADIGRLKVGEK